MLSPSPKIGQQSGKKAGNQALDSASRYRVARPDPSTSSSPCAPLLNRPPPIILNNLVNLFHQPNCFLERDDDALVVGDVVGGKGATGHALFAAPVVEPLAQYLVAADV